MRRARDMFDGHLPEREKPERWQCTGCGHVVATVPAGEHPCPRCDADSWRTPPSAEPEWNGAPIPHHTPEGEELLHDDSIHCACGPQLQTHAIPGIGGAAWYRHNPLLIDCPDTLPEGW